jgi:hypothetical protein
MGHGTIWDWGFRIADLMTHRARSQLLAENPFSPVHRTGPPCLVLSSLNGLPGSLVDFHNFLEEGLIRDAFTK